MQVALKCVDTYESDNTAFHYLLRKKSQSYNLWLLSIAIFTVKGSQVTSKVIIEDTYSPPVHVHRISLLEWSSSEATNAKWLKVFFSVLTQTKYNRWEVAKVSMFNARTIMHPRHIPTAAEEFHQQWLKLNISYYLLTLQNLMFTCLISAGCCIRTLQLDCGNTSTPEGCISPRLKGCLSSTVCGFSWPLVVKSLIKQHGRSLPEDTIDKQWQLRHPVDAVTLINVKEMNCWFLLLLFQ